MDTSDLTQKAQDVRDNLEEQSHDWKQRAAEWRVRTATAVRNASHTADNYVHNYAWSSIALAAVTGCVFGYLLGRRGSD
jgi:ElaB/YqjD/DUF883 family membrane-anchored ribosome-binding protein